MNVTAVNPRFDDLDGLLRSSVEQIIALPPPGESAERVLTQAKKWSVVGVPALAGSISYTGRLKVELQQRRYLAAGAALALVVLLAVSFAIFGRLPREKPIAVSPQLKQTEPKVNSQGVAPPVALPTDVPPEKRLGTQAAGGLTFGGNASQRGAAFGAGANPSRSLSVANEATILVSTGGKDPIQLGEKQAFTEDAVLHVWDWSKSDKSRPLDVSSSSFSVSPDGKWIVTTKGEKVEVATGKVTMLSHFEPEPNRTLFSPDGRRMALALVGKENTWTFRILEFPEGKKLCDIENQWPAMTPVTFAPDGSEIFLMGKDNFVRRFDAATGKELQKYEPAHENSVRRMMASPSGKLLVSGGSRGDILLWDAASGKLLHKLVVEPAVYANMGVYSLTFSPDETQVAGGGVGSLLLWSIETGHVKKFPRDSASAEHIRFSADGKSVTIVRGFVGTAGPAGENLLVYPSVSKWDVADAK